jgi:AhpD family alkylhydroperoxidase
MTRISLIDPGITTGRTKLLLDSLAARRGRVTTMVRVMANSPAAVNGYFSFNAAMSASTLPAALKERIAIVVAEANACATCLAAHTAFGRDEASLTMNFPARGALTRRASRMRLRCISHS